MNRRYFISSALSVPLAARAAQKPIRIAFLGGSYSHAAGKLEVLSASPDWEMVGVWEEDPEVRARLKKSGLNLMSRDQILEDKTIPVIAVETAIPSHAMLAKVALEAGKHVHVEKPPADNVASFRELLTLARRGHRVLQVGYMWRYHPGLNAILEAARRGWLGDIYRVRCTMNKTLSAERRPTWAGFRGGTLFELGGHLIDPMVRLMGRPERVTPFLRKDGHYSDNLTDNTLAVFEFPHALGTISSATMQPNSGHYRAFEVLGTNGTAVLNPIEPPSLQIDLAKAAGPYKQKMQTVKLPPYKRFVDDFRELAAAVRGEKPLSITPRENLIVVEALIHACGM